MCDTIVFYVRLVAQESMMPSYSVCYAVGAHANNALGVKNPTFAKALEEQAHAHMTNLKSQFGRGDQSMAERFEDHTAGIAAITRAVSEELVSTSTVLKSEMEFLGLDGELAQTTIQSARCTKALVSDKHKCHSFVFRVIRVYGYR